MTNNPFDRILEQYPGKTMGEALALHEIRRAKIRGYMNLFMYSLAIAVAVSVIYMVWFK